MEVDDGFGQLLATLAPNCPYGLGGDGLPDPSKLTASHMEGYVWWCGDEVCDCTQAQIVAFHPGGLGIHTLWRGPFHSDGGTEATDELRACFRYLTVIASDVAARIKWPDSLRG